jgi:hypothetical protein
MSDCRLPKIQQTGLVASQQRSPSQACQQLQLKMSIAVPGKVYAFQLHLLIFIYGCTLCQALAVCTLLSPCCSAHCVCAEHCLQCLYPVCCVLQFVHG